MDSSAKGEDRRSEPRQPGSGTVLLRESEPVQREFHGELVDTSSHGFRARFPLGSAAPECGASYRFEHFNTLNFTLRHGNAVVAWIRREGDCLDAGFFVVTR